MTEKRFTFDIDQENGYDEEPYFCDGTDSFYVNNPEEMELLIKEMNELVEENRNLKERIYPVDIDIITNALVTSFAESYVTLVKLDQELERMGFSETNMQRIKIRNKMKSKFESILFEFVHWSRIKGVF